MECSVRAPCCDTYSARVKVLGCRVTSVPLAERSAAPVTAGRPPLVHFADHFSEPFTA
jgi:hypothetical protein